MKVGVWTLDANNYTQTVQTLFTGDNPTYTHAEHIDNSFNFCVNGVSEQNSRMCLHMTDRANNTYTVEDIDNIFIPNKFFDNKGNVGGQAINTILGNRTGGVSNFAISPSDGNQPSANFNIKVNFDYRDIWYPAIGFAKFADVTNVFNIGYTFYSLNDLDSVSTAADAIADETWWEYYERNSADYIMCMTCYHDQTYHTGGAFQSNSVYEGQTRFGFSSVWVSWLSTPHSYGNTYGTVGCYIYNGNGRDAYDDMTFDVLFSLPSDAMVKVAEYNDTNYSKPRHNVVYSPKIDRDLVLRLICSYGLPFSFSSNANHRTFADADYALPQIKNNKTTGKYYRGTEIADANTENIEWVNTSSINNAPADGVYNWLIVDGDDPYRQPFPQMYTVNEPLASFWNIIDGDLPFRPSGYPQMHTVDDVPNSYWRIIDGDDPFRLAFPEMPKPPRIEKRYKGKHSKIIIPIYRQTIPVGKVLRSDPPG